jgi:hypothetical protein
MLSDNVCCFGETLTQDNDEKRCPLLLNGSSVCFSMFEVGFESFPNAHTCVYIHSELKNDDGLYFSPYIIICIMFF